MWTMEELMELKTPFLTMQDITKKDWEHLDFELEKYDIAKEEYDLDGCKVLAFVLQQIHYNKNTFSIKQNNGEIIEINCADVEEIFSEEEIGTIN